MASTKKNDPTEQVMKQLQRAFNHYNKTCFEARLPHCLITLQRKSHLVMGYYSPKRFASNKGKKYTDEIAMNPLHFKGKDPTEILQTLVHEMCHMWQHKFGKPSQRSYHNKEWARKMEAIGLMPSNTGKSGGKKIGQKMSDYPIEGGKFMRETAKLLNQGFEIAWYDNVTYQQNPSVISLTENTGAEAVLADGTVKTSSGTRRKFVCPQCKDVAYGKGSLNLICGKCVTTML
jgi:predicted SprT family Zn-dependent metalloprotease